MEYTQKALEWQLAKEQERRQIQNLQQQFNSQRNFLNERKTKHEQKLELNWQWEQKKLQDRLNELQGETLENEDFIESTKKRIAEFRYRERQVQQRQVKAEDNLHQAMRLNQLDNLIQRKVQLEKISEKRNQLEQRELTINTHLGAVIEQQERRDYESITNLKRILQKAQYLQQALKRGDLDKQNQVLLAHALQQGGDVAQKQRKRIVDQIIAKRQRERQQDMLNREADIQKINQRRWELMKEHQELLQRKEVHERLVGRGVEFLAAMQLGKGPPKEVILKNIGNIQVDPAQYDKPIQEIIQNVESNMENLQSRIKNLKEEREKTLRYIRWINRPYRGEADIRKFKPDLNLDVYIAMKQLVYDLIEVTWGNILEYQRYMDEIKRRKEYFQHKSDVLKEKIQWQLESNLAGWVANALIEEGMLEVLQSVASDVSLISRFSHNIILNFISAGIKRQRNVPQNETEISDIINSMLGLE